MTTKTKSPARALMKAAEPFAAFAKYARAHPRTGLDDALYTWDNTVSIRLSDLLRLEAALKMCKGEQRA